MCYNGLTISVDSDDTLSHHIIKLFSPDSVRDYRCDQCRAPPTGDSPATIQRLFLWLPRFLRVNVTSPPTSQRLPKDFHKHWPLREFERLDLSQLAPQRQPMQGHYVLRAAIMYSHKHHWTYVHGSPPIYVSDETSRIGNSDDMKNVARCARILFYEQYTHSEDCITTLPKSRNSTTTMPVVTAAQAAPLSTGSQLLTR